MPAIESITLGVWGVLELTMRVREGLAGRGRTGRNRWSRPVIAVALGGGIALAITLAGPNARLFPGGRACGITLMWAGIGLRAWSVLALGDSFRTSVEGLLYRISVEEEVLLSELGEPFAEYMSRTKRLVPGVW